MKRPDLRGLQIAQIAQIAHNRDILLIAEGVEKDAELSALTELNVDELWVICWVNRRTVTD